MLSQYTFTNTSSPLAEQNRSQIVIQDDVSIF